MADDRLAGHLDRLGADLRKELDRLGHHHRGLKGAAREKAVAENYLQEFLRLEVQTNLEVFDSAGGISRETDIALLDVHTPRMFIKSGLIPIEFVHGTVEVKSRLTRSELEDGIAKARIIKKMPKSALVEQSGAVTYITRLYGNEYQYFPTVCVMFAYGSDMSIETAARSFDEIQADEPMEHRLDAVFVLDQGAVVHESANGIALAPGPGFRTVAVKSPDSLTLMTTMLTYVFQNPYFPGFALAPYLPESLGEVTYMGREA
jgi:Domain of unknown function (DUF6602)